MNGRVYGYARVSAKDQNLDRQRQALAGVDVLVEEKASGKGRADREKLRTLMDFVQPGDTIRTKSIDRLARDTRDLLNIIHELSEKDVAVEFIESPMLNVSSKEGRAMITVFAAFAQLEREAIRERQLDGIAIAKAAGKYAKKLALTPEQIAQARSRVEAGVPKTRVARDLGVSRMTLHSALTGTGRYAPAAGPEEDPARLAAGDTAGS